MDKESPAVWRGSREPRVNFWRNVNSKATLRPVTFLVPKKINWRFFWFWYQEDYWTQSFFTITGRIWPIATPEHLYFLLRLTLEPRVKVIHNVYEPSIRARLGTAAHFCEVKTLYPKPSILNPSPQTATRGSRAKKGKHAANRNWFRFFHLNWRRSDIRAR